MNKLTTEFQLYISLVIIVILSLVSYVFYFSGSSTKEYLLVTFSEKNETYISQVSSYSQMYGNTGNSEYLNKLGITMLRIENLTGWVLSGQTKEINGKEYKIDKITNQDLLNAIDNFVLAIQDHKARYEILRREPLYETDPSLAIGDPLLDNFSGQNTNDSQKLRPSILDALQFLEINNKDLISYNNVIKENISSQINSDKALQQIVLSVIFFLMLITLANIAYLISKRLIIPLSKSVKEIKSLAHLSGTSQNKNYIKDLSYAIKRLSININEASEFANTIGKGDLEQDLQFLDTSQSLGKAMIDMRDNLKKISEEERKRNWATEGLAKLNDILRSNYDNSIEALTFNFIKNLVKHLGYNQGGIFLINNEFGRAPFIELVSCYAFNKKKYIERELEMKEGLIGQCIEEREIIYMEEIPDQYISITSGLGMANPRSIILVPLIVGDKIYGALEMASFTKLQQYQIDFVETICERLSGTLSIYQMNIQTQKLLKNAESVNVKLQAKEEQMQQNSETLKKTQDVLNSKLNELEEQTHHNQCIIDAVNKTNASVEFDLNGDIIDANEMYCTVMGYSRTELLGKNEQFIIPEDELKTGRHQLLWESLKTGSYIAGEYRRIHKNGSEIWLEGTYNPISDLKGNVIKIIQYAQFTTDEKERDLDFTSKIDAISSAFPIVDLDVEGNLKEVNDTFLEFLGYTRSEFKNKPLSDFLFAEYSAISFNDIVLAASQGEYNAPLLTFKNNEGTLKYCITYFNPIKNLRGKIYKIMLILIDITPQKKLQDNVKETAAKFTQVLEGCADGVITIDDNDNIAFFNKVAEKIWGYSRSEVLGENVNMLIPENIKDELNVFKNQERPPGSNGVDYVAKKKNGSVFPVKVTFSKAELRNSSIFTAFIKDITEQKKVQREVEEQQTLLKQMFSEIDVRNKLLESTSYVFEIDHDGKFISMNNALQEKLKITKQKSTKIWLSNILKTKDDVLTEIKKNHRFRETLPFITSDEFVFWGDTSIVPFAKVPSKIIPQRYLGVMFDISEDVAHKDDLSVALSKALVDNFFISDTINKVEIDSFKFDLLDLISNGEEAQLKKILNNDLYPCFLLDETKNIVSSNKLISSITAYSATKLKQIGYRQFISFEKAEHEIDFTDALSNYRSVIKDVILTKQNKEVVTYKIGLFPIFDTNKIIFKNMVFLKPVNI